jgi:hypothetical protein
MSFWQSPDQIQRARAIPLQTVLQSCGAQPDPHDQRKWHTAQGVLSITGAQFMNWTLGVGGGGAIDLAMHLLHLDFKAALHWLADHGPGSGPFSDRSPRPAPRLLLQLPPPDPGQLARLRRYLTSQRALPGTLVEELIRSGRLYSDHRANAVFPLFPLWFHAQGAQSSVPVGAELRGTSARGWRGLAPGSRKDLGCFGWPDYARAARELGRPVVVLCESAIDTLSCWLLCPGRLCLSTAGARSNPAWLPSVLDRAAQVYCGFDADPTGDLMAQKLIARYPAVRRLRPTAPDWNDLLKARAVVACGPKPPAFPRR